MKRTSALSFLLLVAFLGFTLLESSCDNAKTPEIICATTPTYDNEIAPIINANCAIGGCHISGAGVPGEFVDYAGLLPYLTSGSNSLNDRVIIIKDMPEGFSLPDADFELIRCWVEGGYPEN